jgi:hypothetical protein
MPDMSVVDDHFDRELGASRAAHRGMLVTAMLMIMQKRSPSGAADEKLAVQGGQVRVDVSCRAVGGGMLPGCPEILEEVDLSASRSRLAGAERPPGRPRTGFGRYHDPAFPMALTWLNFSLVTSRVLP